MKQILHIFAKDSRHFWPEILISLALVGALVWVYPSTRLSAGGLIRVPGAAFCQACWKQGFSPEI